MLSCVVGSEMLVTVLTSARFCVEDICSHIRIIRTSWQSKISVSSP